MLNGAFLLATAVISYVAHAIFNTGNGAETQAIVAGVAVWIVAGSFYLTLFWGLAGQTPGMRFFGLRLEPPKPGDDGIGARRAIRRLVGLVLAILPPGLGLLGILINDRRRGFQDRYSETDMVYVPERLAPWMTAARADPSAA